MRVFEVRIRLQSGSFHAYNLSKYADNARRAHRGHCLVKESWGITDTATIVCHATLSYPVILLFFSLSFSIHGSSSFLPFQFPGTKSSPFTSSFWMVSREKISRDTLQQKGLTTPPKCVWQQPNYTLVITEGPVCITMEEMDGLH